MGAFQTREAAEAFDNGGDGTEVSFPKAIERLSDEARALSVRAHGRGGRELSTVIHKLDEARLWAIEFLSIRGTVLHVDKREYVRQLRETELETSTGSTGSTEV